MLPTDILRQARAGFGLRRSPVRLLSRQFGKVCLAVRGMRGHRVQLRLVRATRDIPERLSSETRWLAFLAGEHGLAVPAPMRWAHDGPYVSPSLTSRDGDRWHAVAFSWVGGRHLGRGLTAAEMTRAAAMIARVHVAGAHAPAQIADHRPVWWIPRLLTLATTLRDIVSASGPIPRSVPAALAAGLRHATASLEQAAATLPTGAAHVGLIHTDAHPRNLRWREDRVGLVDFEDCATGRYMLDLACLFTAVAHQPNADRLRDAMFAGYDRVRPLPAGSERDFRVMCAFRQLDFAGWVLSWPRPDLLSWGPALLHGAPAAIASLLDG